MKKRQANINTKITELDIKEIERIIKQSFDDALEKKFFSPGILTLKDLLAAKVDDGFVVTEIWSV